MFSVVELIFNSAELVFNDVEHTFNVVEYNFLLRINTFSLGFNDKLFRISFFISDVCIIFAPDDGVRMLSEREKSINLYVKANESKRFL